MTRLRIGIIGAGPGGICMGVSLRRAGFERFTIFEQADRVGGVWHHNTYPGAACDIPSHLYSFSFAPKVDWSKPYGSQPEIRAYLDQCVDHFGLRPHLRLGTGIAAATWMDDRASWRLTTDGGETIDVDILISALGMFNRPYYPNIAGLDAFAGTVIHTARWDNGHQLSGRRVAVIGSGASAIQLVPEIAPVVSHLQVYQRTPNWVLPKQDTPFTADELEGFRRRPASVRLRRHQQWNTVNASITYSNEEALRAAEEFGRANIAAVDDASLRAKLTPDHPFGCKRPLVSNSWYPTFNLPQVELITDGIASITRTAVVTTTGEERPADTIVLATGFKTSEFLSAIPVFGRGERQLSDAWRDGAHAYLGITVTGFPNLFMLYGPNTNNGSIIYMIECQAAYIMRQLRWVSSEGVAWIEPTQQVLDRYNDELQSDLAAVRVWNAGCSGYYRGPSGRIVTQWPHDMARYRRRTQRSDPDAFVVGQRGSLATAYQ